MRLRIRLEHGTKPLAARPYPDRLLRAVPDRKAILTDPNATAMSTCKSDVPS